MLRALTNDAGNAVFVRERSFEDSTSNIVLSESRPRSILTKVTKTAVPKRRRWKNVGEGNGRKNRRFEQVVIRKDEVTVEQGQPSDYSCMESESRKIRVIKWERKLCRSTRVERNHKTLFVQSTNRNKVNRCIRRMEAVPKRKKNLLDLTMPIIIRDAERYVTPSQGLQRSRIRSPD